MNNSVYIFFIIALIIEILFYPIHAQEQSRHRHNYASILQDNRNEPTPDGTFGYAYKTEDGIYSSARGGPNGVIQGGFSYTDPTGLKVNFNYNAGSRAAAAAAANPAPKKRPPVPVIEDDYIDSNYYEPEPPRQRPAPRLPPRRYEAGY